MSTSDTSLSFMDLMLEKFHNMKSEMEKVVIERDRLKKEVEELRLKKMKYKTRARELKANTTLSNSARTPHIPIPFSTKPIATAGLKKEDDSISGSGTKEAAHHSYINSAIDKSEQQDVQAKIQIYGSTYLIPHIINKIKKNLNKENLEKFHESCFGHLLQIKQLKIQGQVLLQLLMHIDMAASNKECIVFNIYNSRIEFRATEFCLITGLRLGTMEEAAAITTSSSSIHEKVFSGKPLVMWKDIEDHFLKVSYDSKGGDEMPVKLALLYFLYGIFLSGHLCKQVDQQYLHLIEDFEAFNAFPWGRVAYEVLASSMLSARRHIDDSKATQTKSSYNIHGFSVALQVWAYEVLPSLAKYCAARASNQLDDQIPRILRWSTLKRIVYAKDLDKLFTSKAEVHSVLDGIRASPWELEALTTGTAPPKPKNRTSLILKDEMSAAAVPTSSVNAPTHHPARLSSQSKADVVKAEAKQTKPLMGRCSSFAAGHIMILGDSDGDDDETSDSQSKDSEDELLSDMYMNNLVASLKRKTSRK